MKQLGPLVLVSTLLATASLPAASLPSPATVAAAQNYLTRVEAFGFAGAVVVAAGDVVLVDRGLGTRTCSGEGRIDGDTPFYLASLSKAFLAAALLRLEERGLLDLETSMAKVLPRVPKDKASITLLHLLTHRSGLARLSLAETRRAGDRDGYLRAAFASPTQFEPGSESRYSNTGYSVLAAVLEHVTGKPLAQVLREEVFDVAGMPSTGLVTETALWSPGALAEACRAGTPQGLATMEHRGPVTWADLGAVGAVGTSHDLHRWVRCLETGCLLGERATARLLEQRDGRFGLGWVVDHTRHGQRRVWHDGLLLPEGWNGQIRWYPDGAPEGGLHLVVLSSRHRGKPLGWIVARNLERIFLGGEIDWPPPVHASPPSRLSSLVPGRYDLAPGSYFEISRRGDRAVLTPWGQAAVNVVTGASEKQRTELGRRNLATHSLLTHLLAGHYDFVHERYAAQEAERWQPRARTTLAWLRETYGPVLSFEVLHSVALPGDDPPFETYVRVSTKASDVIVRVLWSEGRFWSLSDQGAFLGTTPSAEILPGTYPLVGSAPGRALAWNLADGEAIEVRWDPEGDLRRIFVGSPGALTAAGSGARLQPSRTLLPP